MRLTLCRAIVALTLAGCGASTTDSLVTGPGPSTSEVSDRLAQATLDNPEPALRLAPTDSLNARQLAGGSSRTVQQLEVDYETVFGSLNDALGVTLQSPQVGQNIAYIASQPGTGFFDLSKKPIQNNPLGVTGVSFSKLEYNTTVPLPGGNQSFNVSGGLILPQGITKNQLRGVVVYFHGTTFSKAQVPSNFDTNGESQLMAEIFGSQGYIVVMPDYVGQGVDWQNVHPYVLYPKVSAQTAADMLKAAQPTIASAYGLVPGDQLKLFSVGYSEGGAYSLWFNQYVRSNPGLLDPLYNLTHSVGIEGAYSASKVTYDYLFDDVNLGNGNLFNIQTQGLTNMVKPSLSADAFLSYAAYSLNSNFLDVFNQRFFNMEATFPVTQSACNVNGRQLNIQQAFAQESTSIATQVVLAGLGKTANGSSYPGPVTLFTARQNKIDPLVSANLSDPVFIAALKTVLGAADVDLSAVPNQGVSIVTLDQDSVVPPNNFDDLLSRFPGKIKNSYRVDHTQLQALSPYSQRLGTPTFQPIDHLQGLIFEFLYALNTFNGF